MTTIRLARLEDIPAILHISALTGLDGADALPFHDAPELVGLIYSEPYVRFRPALSIVAEDDAGVLGFAVGAEDTKAWDEELEASWWPDLRRRFPDPGWGQPEDQRRIATIHAPGGIPSAVTDRFPAHMHMNVHPRAHGRGTGRRLFEAWREAALVQDIRNVHIGAARANTGGRAFWGRVGFQEVLVDDGAAWMGQTLGP